MIQDEITKGIGMHAIWKGRLRSAIETGHCEYTPAEASKDNRCEFGKWLYGLHVDEAQKASYEEVRRLHSDFHREVGSVLMRALGGKKEEAEKAIDIGSVFAKTSAALTAAMMDWSHRAG